MGEFSCGVKALIREEKTLWSNIKEKEEETERFRVQVVDVQLLQRVTAASATLS